MSEIQTMFILKGIGLKSKLAEIAELCEEEIESKGRFGANQKILEIPEVIQR